MTTDMRSAKMNSAGNGGGPAFPQHLSTLVSHEWLEKEGQQGMTLRDWFAGMALQGMVAGSQGLVITHGEFAKQSYRLADAMLKERNK